MAPKSVPVPMIRRVRLKNFRSIAECDVELGPLTLLVGPNGSGKSNFLHALDFLSDAVNNGLESAVRRRGGMNSLMSRWALDEPHATLKIEIGLDLPNGRSGHYSLILEQANGTGYRIAEERCRVIVDARSETADEFVVSDAERRLTNRRGYSGDPGDRDAPNALLLPHHADHVSFGAVYRALRGMTAYSLRVSDLRLPRHPDSGDLLLPNGENVASVLARLVERNEDGWSPAERIVDWLSVITPGIEAVHSTSVAGYQVLQFVQRSAAHAPTWTFTAGEISYGTLRTLGVLVALYQGSMRGGSMATLAGIEEPESAVHPGAASALLEAMDEASLTTQVLATTHGATMLEYEDLDLNIVRAVKIEDGRTTIGPIDAVSRDTVQRHLYTAGELLTMGLIEPNGSGLSGDESLPMAKYP